MSDGPRVVSMYDMPYLIMRSKNPCETCNCTSALNPHRMCRRKVEVLTELARFLALGDQWVRVEEGRVLIGESSDERRRTAYCARQHVMRAEWFGLSDHRESRSADWRITVAGLRFLRGVLQVPAKILCTAGVVVYQSIELVTVGDVNGLDLDKDYWDGYPWSDMEDQL